MLQTPRSSAEPVYVIVSLTFRSRRMIVSLTFKSWRMIVAVTFKSRRANNRTQHRRVLSTAYSNSPMHKSSAFAFGFHEYPLLPQNFTMFRFEMVLER